VELLAGLDDLRNIRSASAVMVSEGLTVPVLPGIAAPFMTYRLA